MGEKLAHCLIQASNDLRELFNHLEENYEYCEMRFPHSRKGAATMIPYSIMFFVFYAVLTASTVLADPCESLSSLNLANTTITSAQSIAAGAFPSLREDGRIPEFLKKLPAFCRVQGTIKPSNDSHIEFEVWLPESSWNGKYQGVGNGGYAGQINYQSLAQALSSGYASSSTDTGHKGGSGDASFAAGHPEKLIDFAYRSVHEMALKSKAVIEAFYGAPARSSYWYGCSTGGRQGLVEAQRFPHDFDGIVSVAPVINPVPLSVSYLWIAQATLKDSASYIPASKYPLIHNAVLSACDAHDGLSDGIVDNPTQCRFDPEVLKCSGPETPTCLTASQVEAARKIYAGPKNPRTQQQIYPGLEPGSELLWAILAGGPGAISLADTYFKHLVFKDPKWDFRAFDFDTDVARADQFDNGLLAATDPDLSAFADRGGKLMLIHGWSDQFIGPRNTINYYESIIKKMGAAKTTDFVRLFMVPGMAHCSGGTGPSVFDAVEAMMNWVENGKSPEQIIASQVYDNKVDRTRPLCAYPNGARYKGSGSTDEAENFICIAP